MLGPGLITGASDDDPSGIGTYSQVGSQFGYGLLWSAVFTFPLMAAVQELCARIALQTGVGLGTSLRRKFPRSLVGLCIAALFVANTINVGADLGAVAAGGSMLTQGVVPRLGLLVPAAGKLTETRRHGVSRSVLRAARADILVGMFFSNLVMYFIIFTTAAVLHAHGKTDIQSADQAAQALAPLAGPFAFVLFAGGMIGTGLLAIPILSGSAAYAVKDFFGLKGTLSDKPWYRPTFYALIALSTLPGLALNLLTLHPIRALFVAAIINGLVAAPLMVLIALLGSDRKIMGRRRSGRLSTTLTWIATSVMAASAATFIAELALS